MASPFAFEAEGYLARALQHEVDHLDGVLFVDRLSALKRQFLRTQLDALARGEVPEGHHPPHRGRRRSLSRPRVVFMGTPDFAVPALREVARRMRSGRGGDAARPAARARTRARRLRRWRGAPRSCTCTC